MRGRFLPYVLASVILALSLGTTYGLWKKSREDAIQKLEKEFDFRVREITERIEQRMATYEQVARGTKGFLLGAIDPPHEAFRTYVRTLMLSEHYPGIQGLAISRIVRPEEKEAHVAAFRKRGYPDYDIKPPEARDFYTSITHIEPFARLNLRALGFDMFTEPIRQAAMARARDSGRAAMSGKVRLIQENGEQVQAGVVMYLPVYRQGAPVDTVEERRAAILGWVGAPFRMNDLMRGIEGERSEDFDLTVYDGENAEDGARLFSTRVTAEDKRPAPLFRAGRRIDVAGRPWLLQMDSRPAFEAKFAAESSRFIAIGGVVASILLASLVWTLATGRRRAVALATDMTRELRASEFRWKYALEGAGDGVWDWDVRSGEVVFSRRWKEMLGYADHDIPNRFSSWEMRVHPDDLPGAMAALRAYLDGASGHFSTEIRMLCKDGAWKWVLSRGTAVLRDEEGRPLRIIGTHSDITQRKEAEAREAERMRSLEEARTALHHAQKLEAVGKLTGGVAHDFNNVLQIISANLYLLRTYLQGNEQAGKRLDSAFGAVDRGAKLSAQLLTFARRQPMQPAVTDLRVLVDNMGDLLRQAIGDSIVVDIHAAHDLWMTMVDPDQLGNVVLNLALNARDAMNDAGRLTIRLENAVVAEGHLLSAEVAAGDYVLIAISDTGAGMTAHVMEHAFEPFFTTKRPGEGTGLGLSTAYGFVKQSGGHVRIDSRVGAGTTVSIFLPRCLEREAAEPDEKGMPVAGGSESILVVEDDPEVQHAAVEMLSELGYRVVKADNGDAALEILGGDTPVDLIFTDVVMPGTVRGAELANRAREMRPGVRILFTSGYTENEIMKNGALDQDVPLLGKPYRRELLAHKVRELLQSRH